MNNCPPRADRSWAPTRPTTPGSLSRLCWCRTPENPAAGPSMRAPPGMRARRQPSRSASSSRPASGWMKDIGRRAAQGEAGRDPGRTMVRDRQCQYIHAPSSPPPRATVTAQVHRGEKVFRAIGCAVWHRPEYTEPAAVNLPLWVKKKGHLFSDLLLHNVGTGDGIRQADARAFELEMPPLWFAG